MQVTAHAVPIKLKSLREQRDIIRSSSNRHEICISPIAELQKMSSEIKPRPQNRTPAMIRFKKLDSPKSIHEHNYDTNMHLIEKANAAIEVLEIHKDKVKHSGLLYKRDKGDRLLKSGLVHKQGYKSSSPEIEVKLKKDKELDFMEESKEKKITKVEAKNLVDRLQGGPRYYKKY